MKKIYKPPYNFYQLTPAIFLLEVAGSKNLAYTFLRAQEFYESGNNNFRGKRFSLADYKKWYSSQSKEKTFSYAKDWRGFNIPSHVIDDCYQVNTERTKEDEFFLSMCEKAKNIAKENGYDGYYMLGVRQGDIETLEHEIAHGLFSTNVEYRNVMTIAVNGVDSGVMRGLFNNLAEMGYGENVFIDEAQAYLSTGLRESQKNKDLIAILPIFENHFKLYMDGWSMPTPLEETLEK